ncbi:hypothetical protein SAMN06265795_10777 [Noviherbaspirillum humi]|uniref:Uncharacterized protein n=2 Tax=Noviherbaspirillum humi TaxID=1688639 RepID=A0A239HNI2_9BURK|nr:hypothetical protein SAMN06265795_10777 [Noviherbaspirillum humi]
MGLSAHEFVEGEDLTRAVNILSIMARHPVTGAEQQDVYRHLAAQKRQEILHYDLQPAAAIPAAEYGAALSDGVIYIESKNLGYDFMVLKIDAGSGWGGAKRVKFAIYRSPRGHDSFSFVSTESGLFAALRKLDSMYYAAAREHLP